MNVLINVTHPQNPGGVAYFYRTLRPYFDDNIVYHIVGSRPEKTGRLSLLRRIVGDYRSFIRHLRRGKYDLVHLNPSFGLRSLVRDTIFAVILRLKRTPFVVFFRGWDNDFQRRIGRLAKPLLRVGLFRARAIIVLGSEFSDKVRQLGFRGPVHFLTTVVSENISDSEPNLPPAEGRDTGYLLLARIERQKGVFIAIDAFANYRNSGGTGKLTIAGNGADLEAAVEYARDMDVQGIYFPGYVCGEKKTELMLACDVFLAPTYYGEGMPNALLEAMASGMAIVCRPVGGVRDFFEDGAMGFQTDSKDPEKFAELMREIESDRPRLRKMCDHNSQYAREHFSARTVAAALLRVYADPSATLRQSETEEDDIE